MQCRNDMKVIILTYVDVKSVTEGCHRDGVGRKREGFGQNIMFQHLLLQTGLAARHGGELQLVVLPGPQVAPDILSLLHCQPNLTWLPLSLLLTEGGMTQPVVPGGWGPQVVPVGVVGGQLGYPPVNIIRLLAVLPL